MIKIIDQIYSFLSKNNTYRCISVFRLLINKDLHDHLKNNVAKYELNIILESQRTSIMTFIIGDKFNVDLITNLDSVTDKFIIAYEIIENNSKTYRLKKLLNINFLFN